MPPHRGSQETYDYIAKWIASDFFFSKNDFWHRMGMLGVFGDYILSCVQGDVAEIGTGESSIYLTKVAEKYKRRIYHCDIAPDKIINPLTIDGYLSKNYTYLTPESTHICYERCVLFAGPSDVFFRDVKFTPLALAFIDGDHNYEQAKKDFENFAKLIVDHGYIVLHDTYPPTEEYVDENRCGTVYKLRQEIEADPRFDCLTLSQGTAMGVGMTLCRKKPEKREYFND
jgi:hypothetical protein